MNALVALLALAPVQFEGEATFEALRKAAQESRIVDADMPQRMEFFARRLLSRPYVGWTLERSETDEFCYVSLDRLDCVTFMETVLGLARLRWNSRAVVDANRLVDGIEFTRYRGGEVAGYLSRLHYTSDWIYDNARKGVVKDISKSLPGAERFSKKINFMSENSGLYRQLKANPELVPMLKRQEEALTAREKWFIPQSAVAKSEKYLQTGDIVALTDVREGMDCAHVGLIIVEKGVPHFVHASSIQRKTVFDVRLSDFLGKSHTGIMVARPH
ncbi:MAG: DUF1460 domain-containing protein [Fimbriimonadaceae bacterium]|nr:DUF1460 domain-containing protein [Fimbriimonadaceae bacterium]